MKTAHLKQCNKKHNNRAKVIYFYCNLKIHYKTKCNSWIADGRSLIQSQKKIGERESIINAAGTTVTPVTICNEVYTIETNLIDWWIAKGATKNVTNRLDLFIDFQEFKMSCNIKAAGNETLQEINQRSVRVLSKISDKIEELILQDLWYVPNITELFFLYFGSSYPKNKLFFTTKKC